MRSLVVLVALVVATAGCGSPGGQPDDPTSAPVSPGSPTAPTDDAQSAIPPQRTVKEGVRDARPRPFDEAVLDERDDSLYVVYWTGVEPCAVLSAIEVVEESEQVTVTLQEGFLPDTGGGDPVCIEIAEHVSARVPLERPLGERTLVDGATGEQVPVSFIRPGATPSG